MAGLATLALAGGVAAGAGDGESSRPTAPPPSRAAAQPTPAPTPTPPPPPDTRRAKRRPLTRLVGSIVILRFPGPTMPEYVGRMLRRGLAAGAILFPDNAPDPPTVRALNRTLQRFAGGKAIIGTDQEGGRVRRLSWAAPFDAQPGRSTEAAATAAARASGRDLRKAGLTAVFAPVADLGFGATFMRGRAFPGGPGQVARLTAAAVRGYRGTGVAPAVKHFPGLGGATINTDDAPATVNRSARDIGQLDLPPFRAAIRARAPMIMLSHALYPALDPNDIASQSKAIATDLLRGRLGYEGVAITDSLEARAVTVRAQPGPAAVRSVRAGADLILLTGPGSHLKVVRALLAEARRSRSFRARLEEASARVDALR